MIDAFHVAFFDKVKECFWLGEPCGKYPHDLINYQELIVETQPDVIIECGTNRGGTAFYFSTILDLIGKKNGRVLTCDISDQRTPRIREISTDKIKFFLGSSVSPEVVEAIKKCITPTDRVMVNLDSNHSSNHVLAEMRAYEDLVTKGCYMIVEDGDIGHPLPIGNNGPYEAIAEYMKTNTKFTMDKNRELMYLFSNAVNGYLKKI